MNGNYRGYSDSLESGVNWIGRVPTHWTPLKFKRVLSEKKHTPNPALPAGSISFGNVVYKNSETLAEATKASYQELLPGEFLVNPLNLNFDLKSLRTALADIAVVVSTGYIVLRISSGLNRRFTRWLLQEFDVAHMKTLGAGVRQTINFTDMGNSMFFAPPLEEQTQIAKFLDYETAKIDALIEKQQQLVALLEEKRQAVISHAVTKGLNPDAPLRDSDVDCLGDVPDHWRTSTLGWYCESIRDGTHNPPPRAEGVHRLLSVRNIINGRFLLRDDDRTMTREAFQELQRSYTVELGDVLLAIVGGTTGKSAVAPKLENVTVQRSLAIIRPNRTHLDSHFLNYWIGSDYLQEKIQEIAGKYAAQPGIYLDDVAKLSVPIPPVTEQREIVEVLDKGVGKLMTLITKVEDASDLLRERRTALISAAVTGKIDVRGWKAPEAEAEVV